MNRAGSLFRWSSCRCVIAAAIGLFIAAPRTSADPVSAADNTAAATRPSVHLTAAQMSRWIADLGNDDPDVRENALQDLMSLGREDLPALRDAARAQHGLVPAQVASLREVVTQVFLASEEYIATPNPFLGLHWPPTPGAPNDAVSETEGVAVADRIAGFSAYQMLRPGDVIMSIAEAPDLKLHSRGDFTGFIANRRPGQTLHLEIVRAGKTLHIPVQLAARPLVLAPANPDAFDDWQPARLKKADEYWQQTFGAIDPQGAATTQPQESLK